MKQLVFVKQNGNVEEASIVNVASVPFRSPFRYPGGKTWLVPVIRSWIKNTDRKEGINFVEPFAGGGIVSLPVAFENLAEKILMIELDKEVAAVWKTIFGEDGESLADRIEQFDLTRENALAFLSKEHTVVADTAFSTILKNRIYHGGIITKGSGLVNKGENGKGLASRWYPTTLAKRIRAIQTVKRKISFREGDAFDFLEKNAEDTSAFTFIDPPYLKAGKRLYTHFKIDHEKLFQLASIQKGNVLMTYDNHPLLIEFAKKYDFEWRLIPMKTTHHIKKYELVISNSFDWLKGHETLIPAGLETI